MTHRTAAIIETSLDYLPDASYDVDGDAYRIEEDADGRPASETVVMTVAAVTGTDPTSLPPLYHAIDPDALDSLFSSPRDVGDRVGRTTFQYAGCAVTVASDGDVLVEPDAIVD